MWQKATRFLSAGLVSLLAVAGCESATSSAVDEPNPGGDNIVRGGDDVDVVIGDESNSFRVVNRGNVRPGRRVISAQAAFDRGILSNAVTIADSLPASARIAPDDSLVVGYPIRLLAQNAVFGGVLTKVSVPDDISLGNLKLARFSSLHIRPFLAPLDSGGYVFALVGCASNCSETSPQEPQLTIPILGVDAESSQILLDLSSLGAGLSIKSIINPEALNLEEVATRAVFVDYSTSTLVFDVESEMLPATTAADVERADASPIFITTRWYLKLGSGFNDAFTVRDPVDDLGYFATFRGPEARIRRFATTQYGTLPPIRYYIKNVPAEYRDIFSTAFDDWNQVFYELVGYDLIAYEHVTIDDPRNPLLVNGDIRYNILEWDVDNLASYGGLGPSEAHQFTGETFSGMTLIQGPKIVELYSDWFDVSEQAARLRAAGHDVAAEKMLVEGLRRIQAKLPAAPAGPIQVRLGDVSFVVPAQEPELNDPLMAPFDFDDPPVGETFESYMQGYFREIVAHELGHNLGLRHNFQGSLSGDGGDLVSHSVMEYVTRTQRHKTRIGEYDRQAIGFGYGGILPAEPQPFCTDSEVPNIFAPTRSAECSRDDAGSDPFAFFRENRVRRAFDLAIGRGLGASPPVWTPADVEAQLSVGLQGMAFYATSAEATAATWIRFYDAPERPTDPVDIWNYVVAQIQDTICEPSIAEEITAKYELNPEAGLIAKEHWAALLAQAQFVDEFLGVPIGPCALIDELPF